MALYIASHSADPDGIATHALARIRAEQSSSPKDVVHYFVEHTTSDSKPEIVTLNQALENILDQQVGEVIVADMDFFDSLNQDLIREVARKHRASTWYDHHDGTNSKFAKLEEIGFRVVENQGNCAAELFRKDQFMGDDCSKSLANISMVHDYLMQNKPLWAAAEAFEEVICSGFPLQQLVIDLTREEVFKSDYSNLLDGYGGDIVQNYRLEVSKAVEELPTTIENRELAGRSVVIATMDEILYMKRGMRELKKYLEVREEGLPDYSILFTKGLNNVLMEGYRKDKRLVPPFCREMLGGGRQTRGCFSLSKELFLLPAAVQIEYIADTFGSYLESKK